MATFGLFLKTSLLCKNCIGYFFGNFWKKMGYFFLQHLVTLATTKVPLCLSTHGMRGSRKTSCNGLAFKKRIILPPVRFINTWSKFQLISHESLNLKWQHFSLSRFCKWTISMKRFDSIQKNLAKSFSLSYAKTFWKIWRRIGSGNVGITFDAHYFILIAGNENTKRNFLVPSEWV